MNQDASSEGSHPVPSLSWPSCATATVNDLLEFVQAADENHRGDLIQQLLNKLGPETAGDANADKRIALQSLGSSFIAETEMLREDFNSASQHSNEAAKGFKQIGQSEFQAFALGFVALAEANMAIRSRNVGVCLDYLRQANEHFFQAGRYAQSYQYLIDRLKLRKLMQINIIQKERSIIFIGVALRTISSRPST